MIYDHISDAQKAPSIIALREDVYFLRFETLKLYAALAAVRRLIATGEVVPGKHTLIDSSSGIYALALASACHRYGLGCRIVASTTVTEGLRAQLELLGVQVDRMPQTDDLKLDQNRRVDLVRRLLAEDPDLYWIQQYHNSIHYLGYTELADSVLGQIPDQRLRVVGGVGTGASTGGLAGTLRERGRDVHLVGVQPFGSVSFGAEKIDDPEAIIAGIGSAIHFENVRHQYYDRMHWTEFSVAASGTVSLMREHGIFAGLSSGAAYLAAQWEYEQQARTTLILGPDTGHRYVEAVYSQHRKFPPAHELRPAVIESLEQLQRPWSVFDWDRRTLPEAVAAGSAEFDVDELIAPNALSQ
ncbi:cysteine synthase family protein [Tsukamurella serpentis]